MSKVLIGRHAQDVGNGVVEPGQPIPDGADPAVIKRLTDAGLIADDKSKSKSSAAPSKES